MCVCVWAVIPVDQKGSVGYYSRIGCSGQEDDPYELTLPRYFKSNRAATVRTTASSTSSTTAIFVYMWGVCSVHKKNSSTIFKCSTHTSSNLITPSCHTPAQLRFALKTWHSFYKVRITVVWVRQQDTHNPGKPEILIGAPSSKNLEHR